MPDTLSRPLRLPCGARLPNRLAKAAMTEGLADARNWATERHCRLYRRWSQGGIGLSLTGNVMVSAGQLERPGNVVIDGPPDDEAMQRLEAWAKAGTSEGNHLWMQLSHAGRQSPKIVNTDPVAPSAVPLKLPGGQFAKPRAMSEDEIVGLIKAFADAARAAARAGFTGVEIHGAHGYLISEFLSPLVNRRTDKWGGGLENRARLLLEVLRAVRAAVGPDFPIAVKLNSADFQRGGFAFDESMQVAQWLEDDGLDLLEISGGSYEQPKMMGKEGLEPAVEESMRESTRLREAYFLDYAREMRRAVKLPLMVTGGFRSRDEMQAALADGQVDVIGIGRPLCGMTDAPRHLLAAQIDALPRYEDGLKLGRGWLGPQSPVGMIKALNVFAAQAWYYVQLLRIGDGLDPDPNIGAGRALIRWNNNERRAAKAVLKQMAARA